MKYSYLIFLILFNSCSILKKEKYYKLNDLEISDFFSNHQVTTLIDKNIIESSLISIKKKYGKLEYENLLVFEIINSGESIEVVIIYKLYNKKGNCNLVYSSKNIYKNKNPKKDYYSNIENINKILKQPSGLEREQLGTSNSTINIYDIKEDNTEIVSFELDISDKRMPLITDFIKSIYNY